MVYRQTWCYRGSWEFLCRQQEVVSDTGCSLSICEISKPTSTDMHFLWQGHTNSNIAIPLSSATSFGAIFQSTTCTNCYVDLSSELLLPNQHRKKIKVSSGSWNESSAIKSIGCLSWGFFFKFPGPMWQLSTVYCSIFSDLTSAISTDDRYEGGSQRQM